MVVLFTSSTGEVVVTGEKFEAELPSWLRANCSALFSFLNRFTRMKASPPAPTMVPPPLRTPATITYYTKVCLRFVQETLQWLISKALPTLPGLTNQALLQGKLYDRHNTINY